MLLLLIFVFALISAVVWGVGTLVPDTTSKPITGKDGTADFTIDDGTNIRSLKCHLDLMRFREVTEMTVTDTFCTEGSADQEAGRSQLIFEIAGVAKYDGPSSGRLLPAPQNVAIVATIRTGCTLTYSANFTEAEIVRLVNQTGRISGRGLSKGTYAVVWDQSGS